MKKTGLLILVIVFLCILQIYLVKKKSRWVGLILPLITFTSSLFLLLISPGLELSKLTVVITFILINIPTALYIFIFFAFADKKKKGEAHKTNNELKE